jgi:hypothetical protein
MRCASEDAFSAGAAFNARHHGGVAHVDPDQEAALRRLRAAFGFIEVLESIDHQATEDPDLDQEPEGDEDDDQPPPTDRG